jgi:DsbC/DsbD-like thiol-disulfide interchange protein
MAHNCDMTISRFFSAALLAALCWVPAMAGAQSSAKSVVITDQVRAELLVHAPQGLTPGNEVWVGLQIAHKPEWHTYWKNSGDSGLPTVLEWTLPVGVMAGDIAWPLPKKIPIGNLANYGYEGTVLVARAPDHHARLQTRRADSGHGDQAQGSLAGLQKRVHPRRGRVQPQGAGQKLYRHPRRRL